jgi:hypothetical protein
LETHPGISPADIGRFCRHFRTIWEAEPLIAMQKVEGSNPFSRSRKGVRLQAFLMRAADWCVCVAGHPSGTRRATRGWAVSEQPRVQAFPEDSNH